MTKATNASSVTPSGSGSRVAPILVVKLEPVVKTGVPEVDALAKTTFSCMESIVDDVMSCAELVQPVFNFIKEEKHNIEARKAVATNVPMFASQVSFAGLSQEFKIAFITKHGDLTGTNLIDMIRVDPQHLQDLFQWGLQLPMKAKFPMELLVVEVMNNFLEHRAKQVGNRLETFVQRGGIATGGAPVFREKTGAYHMEFQDGLIVRIHHWNGDHVDLDPACGLGVKHTLVDNHDDWMAALQLKPMPDTKISTFFDAKAKKGPYRAPTYIGKPKDLQSQAKAMHTIWAERRKEVANQSAISLQLKASLDAHKQSESQEKMKKAREAASKALAKKRARTSQKLL